MGVFFVLILKKTEDIRNVGASSHWYENQKSQKSHTVINQSCSFFCNITHSRLLHSERDSYYATNIIEKSLMADQIISSHRIHCPNHPPLHQDVFCDCDTRLHRPRYKIISTHFISSSDKNSPQSRQGYTLRPCLFIGMLRAQKQ